MARECYIYCYLGLLPMFNMFFLRHVLTGSYHNYFRIYDVETTNDVVLQADKSAFKAKKIGANGPGVKGNGMKAPGPGKEGVNLDTIDFNKKILHGSWHPRENTIAVSLLISATNNLTYSLTLSFETQIAATNNLFLVGSIIEESLSAF